MHHQGIQLHTTHLRTVAQLLGIQLRHTQLQYNAPLSGMQLPHSQLSAVHRSQVCSYTTLSSSTLHHFLGIQHATLNSSTMHHSQVYSYSTLTLEPFLYWLIHEDVKTRFTNLIKTVNRHIYVYLCVYVVYVVDLIVPLTAIKKRCYVVIDPEDGILCYGNVYCLLRTVYLVVRVTFQPRFEH